MTLADQVRAAGVVGAGGGGFPAHIKLAARADTVIANGAECEPLLHKDSVLMEEKAAEVVRGLQLAMASVGAQRGVIGIKAKNKAARAAMEAACPGTGLRIHLLNDYYPAGDEFDLVYEVTGRLIPPGGLPLQVGVVVSNIETLMNIAAAAEGRPVTHKTLTVAGAVGAPRTVTVPLGSSVGDVIKAAGGLTVSEPALCLGGVMMGETVFDLDWPVTKTLSGIVVLPRLHLVIRRKTEPSAAQMRIGKSACDQCRYCTELCPRFLLGYPVEPHQVMRSLGLSSGQAELLNPWGALCCGCGLCTLYSCPEQLFPKEACDSAKAGLRRAGWKPGWASPIKPHPMRAGRRVPIGRLVRNLCLSEYDVPAPFAGEALRPQRVELLLKQSAGVPAQPRVRAGDRVTAGQCVAEPQPGALGAALHAPLAGHIAEVRSDRLILVRELYGCVQLNRQASSSDEPVVPQPLGPIEAHPYSCQNRAK